MVGNPQWFFKDPDVSDHSPAILSIDVSQGPVLSADIQSFLEWFFTKEDVRGCFFSLG